MTSNNTGNLSTSHIKHSKLEMDGIRVDTEASIDSKGIIRLHVEMRNKNVMEKKKMLVTLNVKNDGMTVYSLNTGTVLLYGTMAAFFVPGRKASVVINRYGNMSFDYISMKDPNALHTDQSVLSLDREISDLAAEIRKMKILVEASAFDESDSDIHDQFEKLVNRLSDLKFQRQSRLSQIEQTEKFNAISLEIDHSMV